MVGRFLVKIDAVLGIVLAANGRGPTGRHMLPWLTWLRARECPCFCQTGTWLTPSGILAPTAAGWRKELEGRARPLIAVWPWATPQPLWAAPPPPIPAVRVRGSQVSHVPSCFHACTGFVGA